MARRAPEAASASVSAKCPAPQAEDGPVSSRAWAVPPLQLWGLAGLLHGQVVGSTFGSGAQHGLLGQAQPAWPPAPLGHCLPEAPHPRQGGPGLVGRLGRRPGALPGAWGASPAALAVLGGCSCSSSQQPGAEVWPRQVLAEGGCGACSGAASLKAFLTLSRRLGGP